MCLDDDDKLAQFRAKRCPAAFESVAFVIMSCQGTCDKA